MLYLHLFTALAVILFGALVGGRLAAKLRLPRVTGYLLAGLFAGPSFAGISGLPELISSDALGELAVVSNLALAIIMVNIGGQFRTDLLRRYRRRIVLFSLGENATTFFAVALGTLLVNQLLQVTVPGLTLGQTSLFLALLLGLIAMATAPAATLMVIREYEASGPVTNTLLTLVGMNNLASVILFVAAEHLLIHGTGDWLLLVARLFGPIAIGGIFGFVLSVWTQRLELRSEYKILLLGGVATCVAVSEALRLDSLLASLVLGITLANSSPRWHRLLESLRQIDYPLYVVFFVLAGANLHLETLGHIGLLGLVYVLARSGGKVAGAWIGARLGRFGPRERRWIGMTLLAQAGVAIGLANGLAESWPQGGQLVQTVVLGAVVIFEIFGPLAVRHGLVHSGEVPLLSLLQKQAPQGTLEGLHSVVHHFRASLGLPAGHQVSDPGDILVRHIMRQNVETIHNDTGYHELLRLVAHSSYDRFPVVDGENRFIGMIAYTEIRNLLFEPDLARLVVASDLITGVRLTVAPDQSLREVLDLFHRHRDVSYFPVVDPDEPDRLLGILSQNDVLAAFRRLAEDA
ncbi:Kef-type K+ transport system membrane component KefB [Geothermobacter ehrlichii]|uniref:Kef-type K+ transport system membrane component KefB n=1 Tax=Geothermobacter ehrlichii TaxID=213224 RepID=A0A5D3WIQ8_9BACT|nr:cation:proton antiporter [Geothermobacter ehrlichii]TYO97690.1 Kef-type K+ transport system membrane component KefB [Geothermobacter ehrlichii]